jgi:diaminopimelate decarboxylase
MREIAKERVGPIVAALQPRRVDLPLDRWDLSVGSNGRLWLRDHDLHELATTHGTPLHLVDATRLEASATSALAPGAGGAGADIFFSYKTNPVPGVLRRLHRVGIGAEVISAYELWLALELGVPPDRIIYNGPAKSDASLRTAIERRVLLINANSAPELVRIARLARAAGAVANVGVRVSLPGMWGGQFGIRSGSAHLVDAIRMAIADPALALRAAHFHRGGTIRTPGEWRAHVEAIVRFCDDLAPTTGWVPEILDIGGSLACATVAGVPPRQFRLNRALGTDLLPPDPRSAVTVAAASEIATEIVRRHFGERRLPVPAVLMEPGRALTGDAQLLLTSVVDVKEDGSPVHAVLDAGINLADPLPHEYHQLFSASAPAVRAERSYRLVGPICTPADVLYYRWRLPPLDVGHVVAIMDTGAYFVPFSTSFSFPRPPVLEVDGGVIRELRRRESFADLVARDRLPAEAAGGCSDGLAGRAAVASGGPA